MADTNLLVLAREYKKLREEVKKVLSMPKGDKGDQGEKGEKGDTGDTGPQGFPGRDGKDGINGYDGKEGRDGIDGKDGKDGLDGVGVQNAYIDFDNSLVIVLTDGREVNAGFLSQETKDNVIATFKQGAQTLNELLPIQTGNANKFLKTDGENVSWDTLDGSDINLASPPVIGNTTPNAATFTTLTATGQTSLGGVTDVESLRVSPTNGTAGNNNYLSVTGGTTAPLVSSWGTANNVGITYRTRGSGAHGFATGSSVSNTQLLVSHTASAVNYVQVTGAATGGAPTISTQGSDANASLIISAKGTGQIVLAPTNSNSPRFTVQNSNAQTDIAIAANGIPSVRATNQANQVNFFAVWGNSTGLAPQLSAQGSDTNISMAFQSKGTGGISLSTGSIGTNLVNGTTVTALTLTNSGSAYTSVPTVALSAPTTAGGVQAVASITMRNSGNPGIGSGGTGYTVGDALTLIGGTFSAALTATVATVSSGVITGVTVTNQGNYTVLPSSPYLMSGGTGSGAALTLNFIVTTIAITNAGSGYVEQPTVTFSGGGGSGAAAYAGIGSAAVLRSLAGSGGGSASMSLFTPGGEAVRVTDAGGNLVNYWRIQGAPTNSGVQLTAAGSDANISTLYSSRGTSSHGFFTNSFAQQQLSITHTASAVNFVQVTGAATGGPPILSVQGSDTNVPFIITSKGTGAIALRSGGGGATQFRVDSSNSAVNFLQVAGHTSGNAPVMSAQGTDTNIDLALTPKGTGNVRFGTYTAGALSIAGYIEIKDAGGTVRRLAVVA